MIFSGSNGPPSTNHVTCNVREEIIQIRAKHVREEIQERTNERRIAAEQTITKPLYTQDDKQELETKRTRYERGIMEWRPLEML